MPEFIGVHEGMVGITSENLMQAHQADVDIQDDEGVNFEHAWPTPGPGWRGASRRRRTRRP
jgi:hypothetical protein